MLLFNFVNKDYFRAGFPVGVKKYCCGNGDKEQQIEQYEHNKEQIYP